MGSPLRRLAGDAFLVDLYGASEGLLRLLGRPESIVGAQANYWSEHFEEHLQRMIDTTTWAPPPKIRELHGRTLRIEGEDVTDIDAVGVRGSTLLLVSAKGRAFTDAYDRGTHASIREALDHALRAHESLLRVLHRLRERPVGDNYDFTAFSTITGVVAYPFLPFVPAGSGTAEVLPGLPAVVSSAELERFCRSR